MIERSWRLRPLLRAEGWRRAVGAVMSLPSCRRLNVAAGSGTIDDATLAAAGIFDRVANWRTLAVAEAARA
jgi:hypothetical protein